MAVKSKSLAEIMKQHRSEILSGWLEYQKNGATSTNGALKREEIESESREFLGLFSGALEHDGAEPDMRSSAWSEVREYLDQFSQSRAQAGFSPSETATFVFSLKQPLFDKLKVAMGESQTLVDEIWRSTILLDSLGLYVTERYQKAREQTIARQQQEMIELSTPVVTLWEGILALPLIGTLDSERTQVVMESLLQKIVDAEAQIAIIDITGVPTVDTLVAQHLLKTVAAARLMGAECIISGIRPQIAATIVHLGVDLAGVTTKASLADALRVALDRNGLHIASR
ncbi:MAG: STAS domain-containing protein [Candidatus Binataceae bacterium]|nr:STAS domain-containing protein [Candidatus Binataceae bacterium]